VRRAVLLGLLACSGESLESPEGRYSGMGLLDAEGRYLYWAGGGTESGFVESSWRHDLEESAWESLPDLPLPLLRSAPVRHEDQLYMAAGTTSGKVEVDVLLRMDLASGEWTELEAEGGPSPRYKHMAVAVDGEMVLIGGKYDDEEPERIYGDLWRLDLATLTWTEQPTTGGPEGIYRHAMAFDPTRGLIWIQGGFDADETRSDWLWSIDPETWEWTRHEWEDGPPVRASHALVVVDEGLLIWGGNFADESAWIYAPETGTWTEWALDPAPLARDAFITDLSPDGREFYLLGGDPVSEEVPDFVADLWVLDLDEQRWTERVGIGSD
jgi:hypothetical protein